MLPQAASVETEKAAQVRQLIPHPISLTKPCLLKPEKQPKDFDLQEGANLSERKQNFAKSMQRRKVGNRTFPTRH